MITKGSHFILHSLHLTFAMLGIPIREPTALRLQPDPRANRQPSLLCVIKDRQQSIRSPRPNAVASGGNKFIQMLVARRSFDKIRLPSPRNANTRHDLHRHGFGRSMCGNDECERSDEQTDHAGILCSWFCLTDSFVPWPCSETIFSHLSCR